MTLRMLSLFSGIGGIDLAAQWAGIETVAFCEIEPFCQKVLAKHWPGVPIFDDVRNVTAESIRRAGVERVDVVAGGFPCQPYSEAGKRKGESDDRHLWPEMLRIIEDLRPCWVVGENVTGIITLALDAVLTDLELQGYTCQAFVIPAAGVGAPHLRERVWIVAHTEQVRPGGNDANGQATGRQEGSSRTQQRGQDVADAPRELFDGGGRAGARGRFESSNRREDVSNAESKSAGAGRPRRPQARKDVGIRGADASNATCGDGAPMSFGVAPCSRDFWATEPDVGRVAHGIPRRVDRLRALGNAVVPQVIYPIFEAIARIEVGGAA